MQLVPKVGDFFERHHISPDRTVGDVKPFCAGPATNANRRVFLPEHSGCYYFEDVVPPPILVAWGSFFCCYLLLHFLCRSFGVGYSLLLVLVFLPLQFLPLWC